jgi:nucleoside-diphosphate-sugar epimerase
VRVVVTGATGNIGTALLRRLVDEPAVASVVGIARRIPDGGSTPYDRVGWHSLDLAQQRDYDQLTEIFTGADSVVHLAWRITADHDRDQQVRTNQQGSAAVIRAVLKARVPQLVHMSSAAVYSPAPSGRPVTESWPRRGIPGSPYSSDKVAVEYLLDRAEATAPRPRIVRVRPPTVLQAAAASEIATMALGRLAPLARLVRGGLPLLPLPPDAITQVVAADDVADLVGRAVLRRAAGAYHVADEPVLAPADLARLLGGRHVPVPASLARLMVALTFRLRLQPLNPSWLDVLLRTPLLDCAKARTELGWRPHQDARALVTLMREAVGAGAGHPAPPLTA